MVEGCSSNSRADDTLIMAKDMSAGSDMSATPNVALSVGFD